MNFVKGAKNAKKFGAPNKYSAFTLCGEEGEGMTTCTGYQGKSLCLLVCLLLCLFVCLYFLNPL